MRASLRDFVATQLKIRQEILKLGDEGENRYGNIPLKINTGGKTKTINLQRGSFYTQAISRQCIIRMYSGVDIKPGTFPKYPNEPTGVKLAKRFFLEGGTGYNPDNGMNTKSGFSRNSNSSVGIKKTNNALGAYGGVKSRSNPHKGYGIVPMPGITNATIRTVSDYGSLRVAKVNFVCYNLPQLEVLELLYMRPGFPILVEWGWTPYINNNGKIIDDIPYFDDFWKTSSNLWDMHKKVIGRKKKFSANYDAVLGFCKNFTYKGRPDGGFDCTTEVMGYGEIMEGIVGNNESPTSTERNNYADKDIKKHLSESTRKLIGAPPIPDWVLGLENKSGMEDNFSWLLSSLAYYAPLSSGINAFEDGKETGSDMDMEQIIMSDQYKQGVGIEEQSDEKKPKQANSFQKGLHKVINYFQSIQDPSLNYDYNKTATELYANYVVPAGFKGIKGKGGKNRYELTEEEEAKLNKATMADVEDQIFIRWDFLCELINKFVLPQHKNSSDESALTKYSYTEPGTQTYISFVGPPFFDIAVKNSIYKETSNRYFAVGYEHTGNFPLGDSGASQTFYEAANHSEYLVQSIDPNICIMPSQRLFMHETRTGGGDYNTTLPANFGQRTAWSNATIEYPTEATSSSHPLRTNSSDAETSYENPAYHKPVVGPRGFYIPDADNDTIDEEGESNRYIGLIYLNYSFLMDRYKKAKDKKGFSIFKYIQDIWKEVGEKACAGNHDFILHTEEDNATIRVLDLNVDPTKKPPSDVFEFKVQDKESIVREFDFSSTIPNSISSTIAIAAQSPEAFNKDSTTLSTFNKHVESRFSDPIRQISKEEGGLNRLQSYRDLIDRFLNNYSTIQKYLNTSPTYPSAVEEDFGINWGRMSASNKEITSIRKLIVDQTTLIHQFNSIAPTFVNIKEDIEIDEGGWYKNPKFEEYYPTISFAASEAQNTAPIPIEITMAIDGLSGVRIGDVIKIYNHPEYPRLPKGYIRDDIHWVIFGDDHSVTAGQDWVQKLTCQLTLMGSQNHKPLAAVSSIGDNKQRRLKEEEDLSRDAMDHLIGDAPQGGYSVGTQTSALIESQRDRLKTHPGKHTMLNPVAHKKININNPSWNFGERDYTDGYHNGVDIQPGKDKNGKTNNNIYMPSGGSVVKLFNASDSNPCGNGIKVKFADNDPRIDADKGIYHPRLGTTTVKIGERPETNSFTKRPLYAIFCHLKSINKKRGGGELEVGDRILKGEKIGTMGNTGTSSGKHLHYGLSTNASFAGGDPEDPDALGRYETKFFKLYEDGTESSEKVISTYERWFGVDPSYFIGSDDNITTYYEELNSHKAPTYEKALRLMGEALSRYAHPAWSAWNHNLVESACLPGSHNERRTKGWPEVSDGQFCYKALYYHLEKAFSLFTTTGMSNGKVTGQYDQLHWDIGTGNPANGMKVFPSWSSHTLDQASWWNKLHGDPIATKIFACVQQGKFTIEDCPPESVGLSAEFGEISIRDVLIKKGTMKND